MLVKKFSRLIIPMTLSIFYGKAACNSGMCGSAGNSQSPYADMSRLLQSNSNCAPQQCSSYTPLNYQNYNYGGNNNYGGGNQQQASCMPSYYPGSQKGSPMKQVEQQGGSPPVSNDDECEVATNLVCKKPNGQQGGQQGQNTSYTPPAQSQNGGGQSYGGQQQCDCSNSQLSNNGNQNYYQQQLSYNPSYGQQQQQQCDCGTGWYSNKMQSQNGGGSQNMGGPTFCQPGSNGSPYGPSNDPVKQMMPGYDCNNNASYKIPTGVFGVTELPLADKVHITNLTCPPQGTACG